MACARHKLENCSVVRMFSGKASRPAAGSPRDTHSFSPRTTKKSSRRSNCSTILLHRGPTSETREELKTSICSSGWPRKRWPHQLTTIHLYIPALTMIIKTEESAQSPHVHLDKVARERLRAGLMNNYRPMYNIGRKKAIDDRSAILLLC